MGLIRNPKDFLAGLLFMTFGILVLVLSHSYEIGEASRIGPGYFPRVLGILLLALGAILSLRGFRPTIQAQPEWRWRPLAIVLLGVAVFSLAPWLGVILTSMLLVFISSAASQEFRWKEALLSGVIQGVAVVAIFVYGLGIPLPVWPFFLRGGQ